MTAQQESETTLELRPIVRDDLAAIAGWLTQPHIAQWWTEPQGLAAVTAEYGAIVDGTDPTHAFIIEVDGQGAGLAQCYLHADEPEWDAAIGVPDAAGIDLFLIADHVGRGIGTAVISVLAQVVFETYPDVVWCIAAPAQANQRSWRALARAGFQRLGTCEPPREPVSYTYGQHRPRRR